MIFLRLKNFCKKLDKKLSIWYFKTDLEEEFSFARLALPMKDSSGFFRLKESTGKRTHSKADRVDLPEEVCCWFHVLRGLAIKAYGMKYQSQFGWELEQEGCLGAPGGRKCTPAGRSDH